MKLKLEEIDVAVREKVGVALYLAQRLEHAMVCHLLVRRQCGEEAITKEMIDHIEADIGGQTLGRLIRTLDAEVENDPSGDNALNRALRYRNHIAHGFFKSYDEVPERPKRTALMMNRLEIMILEIRSAIDLLQRWTGGIAFTHRVDIDLIERDYDHRIAILNGG